MFRSSRAFCTAAMLLCCAGLAACNNDRGSAGNDGMNKSMSAMNKTCPICGMAATADHVAYYDNQGVATCSEACEQHFNALPATEKRNMMMRAKGSGMNAEMNNTGVNEWNDAPPSNTGAVAQWNHQCPFSGRTAKGEHYAMHEGKRVDFCCPSCVGKFNKMSDAQQDDVMAKAR